MASQAREKFATQVNLEILSTVRTLAEQEGRQLQSLVDEALADLIEKRKHASPRANVMAACRASHERFAALWESLAQNHPFIDGNKRTAFAAT